MQTGRSKGGSFRISTRLDSAMEFHYTQIHVSRRPRKVCRPFLLKNIESNSGMLACLLRRWTCAEVSDAFSFPFCFYRGFRGSALHVHFEFKGLFRYAAVVGKSRASVCLCHVSDACMRGWSSNTLPCRSGGRRVCCRYQFMRVYIHSAVSVSVVLLRKNISERC